MVYLYHEMAGSHKLCLEGDEYRYIIKVRRHKVGDILFARNLKDGFLYRYLISSLDKKSAYLTLQESSVFEVKATHFLHIGWCIIDPKSIEKVLPSLNAMGVEKITFIYCKRSQNSFKLDFKRLNKILLSSSQQSGRSEIMKLEIIEDLKQFLKKYPQSKMLHFSTEHFIKDVSVDTIVVGCEGGFDDEEITLFKSEDIIGFDTPLVLKSESAVCAVASKLLL